eukprot:3033092-Pyramimonas_sp.AAC.1
MAPCRRANVPRAPVSARLGNLSLQVLPMRAWLVQCAARARLCLEVLQVGRGGPPLYRARLKRPRLAQENGDSFRGRPPAELALHLRSSTRTAMAQFPIMWLLNRSSRHSR